MATPSADLVKSIIGSTHKTFSDAEEQWKKNESLFRGDDDVYENLKKYTWETGANSTLYDARKGEAVYVEFPGFMVEKFVGVLADNAPEPDFGQMGSLSDKDATSPSQADLIYENCDGTGNDARSWHRFWSDAMEMAPATGFRWIMAEAPTEAAGTFQDEIDGKRPYLVEFSPLQVPNWHYSGGTLQWARIQLEERVVRVDGSEFKDETKTVHYLLVRAGFEGLGPEFAAGGWWMFDTDGVLLNDDAGAERAGTWEKTAGEIPLWRMYYEKRHPRQRKKGLSHIGRMAVAFMNLLASLLNDAWVSGGRQKFIVGVSSTQWKEVIENGLDGGIWVPIPTESGTNPSISDAGSVSANEAIGKAMDRMLELVIRFVVRELATSPDASGVAREKEMLAGNSPRLAHMAKNMEEAQRVAIWFLELRNGHASPSGTVDWPKNFDLRTTLDKIRGIFEIMATSGAQSATLVSSLVSAALSSSGLSLSPTDADETPMETVETEIRDSIANGARADGLASQVGSLL